MCGACTANANRPCGAPAKLCDRRLTLAPCFSRFPPFTLAFFHLLHRWVNQLEEEFFRQGDVERAAGMTISPLFDRSKQGITKSQVGFFDIVIIPLFHTFSKVFGNCKPLLTYVMRNYRYW
jgi:hypothetical protein